MIRRGSGGEAHLVSALATSLPAIFSLSLTAGGGEAGPEVLQTSDITSPPPPNVADDVISPPPSSRPRMGSSPGHALFSSPPTHVPTSEVDLSSPLNFGTPSSRIMGTPGGSRGTPIRPRGDIGASRRVREVNLNQTDPPVSLQCLKGVNSLN